MGLMIGLFDALKANPHLAHAEALRLSMLKMIDNPSKPLWAQPKYWAPFIVVGESEKHRRGLRRGRSQTGQMSSPCQQSEQSKSLR
jgi:hypothetical protein